MYYILTCVDTYASARSVHIYPTVRMIIWFIILGLSWVVCGCFVPLSICVSDHLFETQNALIVECFTIAAAKDY